MSRVFRVPWPLLLCGAVLIAADPPKAAEKSPAEQYQALLKQYNDANQEFSKLYQEAKTDEAREKVFREKYPQPDRYAGDFMALAAKYPKDPAAVDALVWVATRTRGQPAHDALAILAKDHVTSDKIGPVCRMVVYTSPPEVAKPFLAAVLEKNPDRGTRAAACLSLAQMARGAETEELFERVKKEFGDVKTGNGERTYGDVAEGHLFEIRNLAIGKVAPDIEGEDIDGKKFKLSDYRGKVVVIDFWGNW
jgi:hypothetical protein